MWSTWNNLVYKKNSKIAGSILLDMYLECSEHRTSPKTNLDTENVTSAGQSLDHYSGQPIRTTKQRIRAHKGVMS